MPREGNVDYDRDPDTCPLCNHGIEPRKIEINFIERDVYKGCILQIIYRCPRQDCQRAFIASYKQNDHYPHRRPEGVYILRSTAPFREQEPDIPDEVKRISSDYADLLHQSQAAEHYQLNQIAGCGYRKALEFLVKDYASHRNPEESERIKSLLLANCINEHIDDQNIKECARRAAWLGNDETHYTRKWEDKDIEDLKTLIRLTQAWILNNLLTEKYLQDMQPPSGR